MSGGEGGIDSALRASPSGRHASRGVPIASGDWSNPFFFPRGFEPGASVRHKKGPCGAIFLSGGEGVRRGAFLGRCKSLHKLRFLRIFPF